MRKETDAGRADDSSQERSGRFATSVRKIPIKNMFYLNVRPLWFHDNITSRLGNVGDAYIGWCNIEDSFFQEFIQEGEPLQLGSGDSDQILRTTEQPMISEPSQALEAPLTSQPESIESP